MSDTNDYMARSRDAWKRAGDFPVNKSEVYPEHPIVQQFDRFTGLRVLEYGSGPGADAYEYARRDNKVLLCDIVADNLERARDNITRLGYGHNIETRLLTESHRIMAPDESFDVINSHGVLHHIPKPLPILREFYRLLKPGGFVYIMLYTEFLYQSFAEQIKHLMRVHDITEEEAFGWCTDGQGTPYSVYYTEDSGAALLESAGFIVEDATLYQKDLFRTFRSRKEA